MLEDLKTTVLVIAGDLNTLERVGQDYHLWEINKLVKLLREQRDKAGEGSALLSQIEALDAEMENDREKLDAAKRALDACESAGGR